MFGGVELSRATAKTWPICAALKVNGLGSSTNPPSSRYDTPPVSRYQTMPSSTTGSPTYGAPNNGNSNWNPTTTSPRTFSSTDPANIPVTSGSPPDRSGSDRWSMPQANTGAMQPNNPPPGNYNSPPPASYNNNPPAANYNNPPPSNYGPTGYGPTGYGTANNVPAQPAPNYYQQRMQPDPNRPPTDPYEQSLWGRGQMASAAPQMQIPYVQPQPTYVPQQMPVAMHQPTVHQNAPSLVQAIEQAEVDKPWVPFIATLVGLFASLGLNAYLGIVTWDLRDRYRMLVGRMKNDALSMERV